MLKEPTLQKYARTTNALKYQFHELEPGALAHSLEYI